MDGKENVSMDSLIQINQITKSYQDHQVLSDLSLSIQKGEVVALIGSSGCGKSTLVRCLAGLESIQKGQITICNEPIVSVKDIAGKVGMVFQNFNLFPHYSVLDNVTKPLRIIQKMEKNEAERIGLDLLHKVHLEDQAHQYPNTLSGGQKQRVAIARALAMNPEILIFDEPTSSLDPELAHEVFDSMKELAQEGQTMIIVTHQIQAIKSFATRVVFLNQGNVGVDGTVQEVLTESKNPELTQFIRMVEC